MKTIKKVNYLLTQGKVEKTEAVKERLSRLEEPVEVEKKVMDSTAENLILNTEFALEEAKEKKATTSIVGWVEKKDTKKTSK